jgi:protein-disulfide isomerase
MTLSFDRRAVLVGLAAASLPGAARAAREPQRVPIELVEEALELESAIRVGNRHGDVTMVEFFDYNCPWCRRSAQELPALLKAEPDLAYVLVNFAVLGVASVEAAKLALGFFDRFGPQRYYALHQRLFALRGPVDGRRTAREAEALGANLARLAAVADSQKVTNQMKEALRVGDSLGLVATPSFLVGPEAYVGGITLEEKRAIVAKARA